MPAQNAAQLSPKRCRFFSAADGGFPGLKHVRLKQKTPTAPISQHKGRVCHVGRESVLLRKKYVATPPAMKPALPKNALPIA